MNPPSPSILIIDQEEAVRESLQLVLNEEGFRCRVAESRSDALQLLSSQSINLAILDSQLPDSAAILQTIKKSYPIAKVIILSSYSEFEVTQQALAAGADNYALKPLDFDDLIAMIRSTLAMAPEEE